MEKFKLTVEQEVALKEYKDFNESEPLQTYLAAKDTFTCEYKSLVNFTADEFARLLYQPDSYEVEISWNIGDWTKYWNVIKKQWLYGVIKHTNIRSVDLDIDGKVYVVTFDRLKSCTPEEIKAKKECKVWKSIGREVGEFTEADIGIDRAGNIRDGKVDLEHYYKNGTLVRLYPAESAISFRGGEE